MNKKLTRSIHGDSEIWSYFDEFGNFTALIQPRPATEKEIMAMFADIPGVVMGKWEGVKFVRHKKNYNLS